MGFAEAPSAPPLALPRLADRHLVAGRVAVSPFCLGLVTDPRMIAAAFDAGVNFFFVSADLHWPLYEPWRAGMRALLARGGGVRDEIVVAAVSYMVHAPFVSGPFYELLHALPELGRLDLLVAGGCYGSDAIDRLRALGRLQAGVTNQLLGARAIAASFHERGAALRAACDRELALAFVRHNAAHPHGKRDLFAHLPVARETLIYAFKTTFGRSERLAHDEALRGYWIPAPADHYRYALSTAGVDGLLLSVNTPGELRALDDALARGPLSGEEQEHLELLAQLVARRR